MMLPICNRKELSDLEEVLSVCKAPQLTWTAISDGHERVYYASGAIAEAVGAGGHFGPQG